MHQRQPLLTDIIAQHGVWRASQPAVVGPDGSADWAAFNRGANQIANGLLADGLEKGARVGVVMTNSLAMLEVMIGVMKAGGVVVPLNTTVSDDAMHAMLNDAGVAAIFATTDHAGRLDRARLPRGARLIARGWPETDIQEGWADCGRWRSGQPHVEPGVVLAREDYCNIIYSSGTTGLPKGITHDHGGRLDWAHDLGHALRYDCAARTLVATGLYSNITWAGMLPTLLLGGALFVLRAFDAGEVLRAIERDRLSHTSMVPVQYQRVLDHPDFDRTDRSSMRAMMCCGSPLPVHTKETLYATFPGALIELYGTTEGLITTLAPEEAPGRMTSVGKPLPGEELIILDGDDRPLPRGESGEIVMLSRFMMTEYWNNPEATAETQWVDEAGRTWLRSGDIGRVDAEGYLYVTDRKKDMIISGGQNVYPADIEAALCAHEGVADCAVIGVPSEKWGETPLALVVARAPDALDADGLRDWLNARVGKQQRVSAVELRDALPRNANGKILKRELRAAYWPSAKADA